MAIHCNQPSTGSLWRSSLGVSPQPSRRYYDENLSTFRTVLTGLLANDTAIRLTVDGYMPLSVEDIGQSAEGNRLISICHYGEQNGDLMRDPDMVFEIHIYASPNMAEPLSFRNDYMGLMQKIYHYDDSGKKTHVNARLKQDLKSFAHTWFNNLKNQGFLGDTAIRERLT